MATGRSGLAVTGTGGGTVSRWEFAQLAKAAAGDRRALCELLGGPGLFTGGAATEADLELAGTAYPPFLAAIRDSGLEVWWIWTDAAMPMTFDVSDGAAKAYAQVVTSDNLDTPTALGGVADVAIIVQAAADPAPASSLLLGSGTVEDSAFTDFTGSPPVAWPPAGASALDDLTDVDLTGVGDDDVLAYDAASETWKPVAQTGGSMTDFLVAGDVGVAQTIADGDTLSLLGAASGIRVTGEATDVLRLALLIATTRPGLELLTEYDGSKRWQVKPAVRIAWPVVAIGNGVDVIEAGVVDYIPIPHACTIVGWRLISPLSGNLTVDIQRSTWAAFPPVSWPSLCGGDPPSLSGASKNSADTLSGWTTALAAGDVLRVEVTGSPTTHTRATLELLLDRG